MVTRLLLATSNPAKLVRLQWVVQDLGYVIITPYDLEKQDAIEAPETGHDFTENAAIKAAAWSRAAGGMAALATDGGLRIPALGPAWDALTTKRNAGQHADDDDRARHLLDLMDGLHGEARHAFWHEAVALASGDEAPRTWSAVGDGGYIAETYDRGSAKVGFWTEALRFYPAAGALYRDLGERQLQELGTVWPGLRRSIRAYLRKRRNTLSTGNC
jgi:inosine/xanthosine triphosphate pyrophosphatase family protein